MRILNVIIRNSFKNLTSTLNLHMLILTSSSPLKSVPTFGKTLLLPSLKRRVHFETLWYYVQKIGIFLFRRSFNKTFILKRIPRTCLPSNDIYGDVMWIVIFKMVAMYLKSTLSDFTSRDTESYKIFFVRMSRKSDEIRLMYLLNTRRKY